MLQPDAACFLDNDVVLKLSAFNLLEDALTVLAIAPSQIRLLSTAKWVFQDQKKKRKQPYPSEAIERAILFAQKQATLDFPSTAGEIAQLEVLLSIPEIDLGEAGLIVAAGSVFNGWLLTGDKRCLQALPKTEAIHQRLQGRVICLEQIFRVLVEARGADFVRTRIQPGLDRTLDICFGKSVPANDADVLTSLDSYIRNLQAETAGLLWRGAPSDQTLQ